MQQNILVDLNVILDILLQRSGFKSSQAVLESHHNLFISGHMVTTFAYILEQAKVPQAEIKRNILWLLNTFSVVATSDTILKNALKSKVSDYEDAVVEQSASNCEASVILTRNIRDFINSVIPPITPENFIY